MKVLFRATDETDSNCEVKDGVGQLSMRFGGTEGLQVENLTAYQLRRLARKADETATLIEKQILFC